MVPHAPSLSGLSIPGIRGAQRLCLSYEACSLVCVLALVFEHFLSIFCPSQVLANKVVITLKKAEGKTSSWSKLTAK